MTQCSCNMLKEIKGVTADDYAKTFLKRIAYQDGGWRQLWQCTQCGSFLEMTWEKDSGGFDTGITVLRIISDKEKAAQWPGVGC